MAKKDKAPTPAQVKAEIEALRNIVDLVTPMTMFGDNNRAAIEAQIRVLEEDLDNDEIYERYDPYTRGEVENDGEGDRYELDNALQAREWLDHGGDAPSTDWQSLIR